MVGECDREESTPTDLPGGTQTPKDSDPVAPPSDDPQASFLQPAKLGLDRARLSPKFNHVDVLAPITARASGKVKVEVHADGQKTRFEAPINTQEREIRFKKPIPERQADLGTGILTLTYPGNSKTQPQEVRLRAANNPSLLTANRPAISSGNLTAKGGVSSKARGVVRLQLQWTENGASESREYNTQIKSGSWNLKEDLDDATLGSIANRDGTLHSSILFTGDFSQRMRGEMKSYQVLDVGETVDLSATHLEEVRFDSTSR
jgi:hypothetical protein